MLTNYYEESELHNIAQRLQKNSLSLQTVACDELIAIA